MRNIENSFDALLTRVGRKTLTKKEIKERDKKENEILEKMKYCEQNGHTSSGDEIVANGSIVYGTCSHCNGMYKRGLTGKEATDYRKRMNRPMTI